MGGLALKNTFTRRVNKDEFFSISRKLLEALSKLMVARNPGIWPEDVKAEALSPSYVQYVSIPHIYLARYSPHMENEIFACVPRYFEDKDSFGDVDMLVSRDLFISTDVRKFIEDEFSPGEIYHNTNVWSFDVDECQVDLIMTPHEDMAAAFNYFSYNDLGNLMGRIAHKFDTKFGQDGLRYVMRGNGKIVAEINLSKDIGKISAFLGLEARRKFEDLQDIFDYVRASRYFNPFMYDMEHLNKINRDRNKKRKTYQSFLEYCEPLKREDGWYRFHPDKKVYLGYIEAHFPGFLKQYMEHEDAERLRQACNDKFNGNILMSVYGVTGKDLGAAMTSFDGAFESKEERQKFILDNSVEDILAMFESTTGLRKQIYVGMTFGQDDRFTVTDVSNISVTYTASGIEGAYSLSRMEFVSLFRPYLGL